MFTKNNDEHNIDKEPKILLVFDDMIADTIKNKKLNSIVTQLFIREYFPCFYYPIIL